MSDDLQLTVKVAMESQSFQQQISNINRQMKVVQSEFANASSKFGEFGSATDKLKAKSASLAKELELAKQKVTMFKEAQDKAKETLEKNVQANEKLKEKINSVKTAYEQSVQATGKNSEESKKLKTELDELNKKYKDNQNTISNNVRTLDNYKIKTNEAEKSLNNLAKELKIVERELANSNSKWVNAANSIKKAEDAIKNVGSKFKTAGEDIAKAGAVITSTFGIVGGGAIKSYEEVKTGTDQIAKLTGATGEKFKELKNTFENVAENSAASFEDIGIAVGRVSQRLNLTGKDLEKASLDFMKFAKVNNIDVTQSVALVSRAMGDAGIKTTEYKSILDLLTTASQNSGIQISVLAENLAKYGAPMRALGFDTKQTIALFSGWEKAGVNTEIAFSGMKKAISNWGAAGKDSSIEFKKVLKDIAATPDIAKATTKAIEIFGAKAGPDLADAIKGGRFAYEDFLQILEKSPGTLDATAKQIGGHTAEMKKAWHSVTLASAELGESIAKELAPILKDVASVIKNLAKKWNELDEGTKSSIAKFGLAVVAIGGITTALGAVMMGIGGFINGIGSIAGVLGKLTNFLSGMKLGSVVTSFSTFGSVITKLVSPIGVAIAAILGLIAIFTTLYNTNEGFRKTVNEVWTQIQTIIGGVIENLKIIISIFVQVAQEIWKKYGDDIVNIATTAFNLIATVITSILGVISNVIKVVSGIMSGDWSKALEGMKGIATSIFNGIFGTIKGVLELIKAILKADLNVALGTVTAIFGSIKNAIMTPIRAATDFVKSQVDKIKGFFSNLHIQLPHIKLPHFSLEGNFSLNPPSVPHLGVNWYDKGGVFSRPSIIGVGEKRPEFVGALDDLRYLIRSELDKKEDKNNSSNFIMNLNIEKFINNSDKDIEQIAEELEFYRQRIAMGRGGV